MAGSQARIRLVVLDVDGTLLDPSGAITSRVGEAVRAAHDKGCLVSLASGRRLWAVRPIVEALGIKLPVILYNGAIIYDLAQDTVLFQARLDTQALRAAVDLLWDAGYQPVVYESPTSGERVYSGLSERDNPATAYYFDRPTVQPIRLDRGALGAVRDALLLAAMGDEPQVRELETQVALRALQCQTLVERQSFVPGSRWWQLDVTAPRTSKGEALRHLCSLTGVAHAETLALGDGINDLELLRSAGLGVAMGNAVAELKQAAVAVVADNAHDGAAEALERFVLGARVDEQAATIEPAQRV